MIVTVIRLGKSFMAEYEFYSDHPRGGLKLDAFVPFLGHDFQLQIIPHGQNGRPTDHQLVVLEALLGLDASFVGKLNSTATKYLDSLDGNSLPSVVKNNDDYRIYGIQVFGWQNPPIRSFAIFARCSLHPTGYIEWIVQNEALIFCGPNDFHWGDGKPKDIANLLGEFSKLDS